MVFDYFAAFTQPTPPTSTISTATGVETPRNGTPRTDGDLHPYAAAILEAWTTRLNQLPRPWYKGAAWDNGCFIAARKLVELANSPWAGYSHTSAHDDYMAAAPYDHVWDKREKCWHSAVEITGTQGLPKPDPRTPIPDVSVLLQEADAETADDDAVIARAFPLVNWHEVFAADDDGEEWILDPILPARRIVALYSAPKAGKSLLVLEMAVAIARGTQALGTTVDRPRRVLYVDFENDPRGDVRARLESMDIGPDDLDNLCYLSFPTMAKLDTEQGSNELVEAAKYYDCEVIVIDTVSRAVAGEENDNDTWLSFYRRTGLKLKQNGLACLRLDHSGKDAEKGMRGGSAKYGDVDAVWRLTALSETTIQLECTDHRMPLDTTTMVLIRRSWPLRHEVSGNPREVALDVEEQRIIDKLDGLNVPTDWSLNAQVKALREAGDGANRQRALKAAKARKLRLDRPTPGGSGTTPEPPGTTGREVVPEPPPRRGGSEPPAATGSREPEPAPTAASQLVGCNNCHRPTDQHLTQVTGGLCPTCFNTSH